MASRQHMDTRHPLDVLREIDWDDYLGDPSGDTSSLSFVSGLVLGMVVGVIVGLLLAPQSGRRAVAQAWHTGIELRQRSTGRWVSDPPSDETLADEAEQSEADLMRRLHTTE
jgi:hypothetical protein